MEKKKKKRRKQSKFIKWLKSVPHLFAKSTIIYCVICATAASAYGMRAQAHGASMEGVLGIVLGFFGGELLLLCLKTVLGKDGKEDKDNEKDVDESPI